MKLEHRKIAVLVAELYEKDDMVNAGAHWVDEEVVQDERIITSRHPGDLPAFCRTLIGALA